MEEVERVLKRVLSIRRDYENKLKRPLLGAAKENTERSLERIKNALIDVEARLKRVI